MTEKRVQQGISEEILFEYYRKTKDEKIRDEIFNRYVYIAQIIAKRFCGRGIDYDDLYQVACIGLLLAIERFDTSKGVKFTSFATPTVSGEIKRYFRDKGNFIRVPRRLYEIFSKAHRIRLANSAVSTSDSVGDGGTEEAMPQVISIENELLGNDIKFEHTLGHTDDGFLMVEDKDFVSRCMEALSENEREFVYKRYYEEKTQKQIASDMGVSQMCISRMERKVLKRLRDMYFKDDV